MRVKLRPLWTIVLAWRDVAASSPSCDAWA